MENLERNEKHPGCLRAAGVLAGRLHYPSPQPSPQRGEGECAPVHFFGPALGKSVLKGEGIGGAGFGGAGLCSFATAACSALTESRSSSICLSIRSICAAVSPAGGGNWTVRTAASLSL